ncbi:hypothetical protein WV31_09815 [Magnetospirillum sp. ME-1]|uniref:reverse transcriptase domain-containing protein n=1 Tax=Magnetospirillum sp. ME-1 TaxID=1639348 RepID=UPI000A17D0B4|nr:reverse transcriptase domain-containing protein [Magnetospirillum sp. ME-1]ARJ65929.1 hypothetical protein WV31_09815 [Magnetospirillum sp. ME-1]
MAIIQAQKGMSYRPDFEDRMCMAELPHYASKMAFYHDCGEPIRARFEPKYAKPAYTPETNPFVMPEGGIDFGFGNWVGLPKPANNPQIVDYRPICSFGILRRAQQIMVRDMLEAILGTNHLDFNQAGRGARAAIAKITSLIATGDFSHVVVSDISNCFGSLKHDGVKAMLPLPGSVVDHVVLTSEDAPIHFVAIPEGMSVEYAKKKARQGIPQGSLVSPFVARTLLDPTLRASALGGEMVVLVDDLLALAGSYGEASAIKNTLQCEMANHPAGPFALKHVCITPITEWSGFLGYRIGAVVTNDQVLVVAAPSNKSLAKFASKLEHMALAGATDEQIYRAIVDWGRSWDWTMANEHARSDFENAVIGTIINSASDRLEAAQLALAHVLK